MPTRPVSLPSPVGGLNTRDALDEMPPGDAIAMTNWWPTFGRVEVRTGYASACSSVGEGDVQTVAEYHAGGQQKLIACSASGGIYNAGGASGTLINSGYSNGKWQWANFNGVLVMVNGADTPVQYDGSSATDMSWTASGGSAGTPDTWDGVVVFKNRLFFWDTTTQDFWYAPIDSVSGTCKKFSLSRLTGFGGNLLACASWTMDGGDGVDDRFVIFMSSGEVLVYQGTDPGDSTAWALEGIYRIAPPLSVRSVAQVGPDLVAITTSDVVSLSQVLRTGQVGQASKVSKRVTTEAAANASQYGWQAVLYRSGQMLLFNIPQTDGTYDQLALNTATGAWTAFSGIPSIAWAEYSGDLYFGGGSGKVYQWTGSDDDGSAIDADVQQSWNDFRIPTRKRIAAIRPVISAEGGTLDYTLGVGFDFRDVDVSAASISQSSGTPWGSPWGSSWGAIANDVSTSWRVQGGTGYTLAPRIRVAAKIGIRWLRTDMRLEVGRNL